jgi:hypothetical protein
MSRMKLTLGSSATKAVCIARPKGHNTLARDTYNLDRDYSVLGQLE